MRQFSAILLISLFAFSQYGRQLTYLECQFSNTFKTGATKCDCDEKAGLATQDSDQSPLPKIHTHVHPDEFFSAAKEIAFNTSFNFFTKSNEHLHNVNACEGIYAKPWQPPNA